MNLKKLLLWSVALVALYALLGFFLLPWAARPIVERRLGEALRRPVSLASLRINPFAFSATVNGLSIRDPDGQAWVAWERLRVDLSPLRSLGGAISFDEIVLESARLEVRRDEAGRLNFADLLEKPAATDSAPGPRPPEAAPREFRVRRLAVSDARLRFSDRSRPEPFSTEIGPAAFTLENFATRRDHLNTHGFEAVSAAGETLRGSGQFSLTPLRASGEIALQSVLLKSYRPYYAGRVGFDLLDGLLDASGRYELTVAEGGAPVLRVEAGALALRGLRLAEANSPMAVIDLPSLRLSDLQADTANQTLAAAALEIEAPRALLRREADGAINLARLFALPAATTAPSARPATAPVTPAAPAAADSARAWRAALKTLTLRGGEIQAEDLAAPRPVKVALQNVVLEATNLTTAPEETATAKLSGQLDGGASFNAEANVRPTPRRVEGAFAIERLPLSLFDAYAQPFAAIRATSGTLGLRGRGAWIDQRAEAALEARVEELALADARTEEEILRWKALRLENVIVASAPLVLRVGALSLEEPSLRLVLEKQTGLNLTSLLAPASDAAETASAESPPAAGQTPPAEAAPAPAPDSPRPSVAVERVALSGGSLAFLDRTIEPAVALAVTELTGSLSGFTSENPAAGELALQAKVEKVGPVSLAGKLNPLAPGGLTADVGLACSNVELTAFSSYAGKYVGQPFERGKLALDLRYRVAERRLASANVITIDQLALGAPTGSPDAVKLPIGLAIALLQDRNGKIVLDVPVEGRLDDPNFRIGRVVVRALGIVLTKAVTSPFALLGSVFGGGRGEELSFLEFQPGRAELVPGEEKKVETLAKALTERPQLRLEIAGLTTAADLEALRREQLESALRGVGEEEAGRAPAEPNAAALSAAERAERIGRAYRALASPLPPSAADPEVATEETRPRDRGLLAFLRRVFGRRDSEAPADTAANPGAESAAALPSLEQMESELLQRIDVPAEALRALASARAAAVREALLARGPVAAERLFTNEPSAASDSPLSPRAALALK